MAKEKIKIIKALTCLEFTDNYLDNNRDLGFRESYTSLDTVNMIVDKLRQQAQETHSILLPSNSKRVDIDDIKYITVSDDEGNFARFPVGPIITTTGEVPKIRPNWLVEEIDKYYGILSEMLNHKI